MKNIDTYKKAIDVLDAELSSAPDDLGHIQAFQQGCFEMVGRIAGEIVPELSDSVKLSPKPSDSVKLSPEPSDSASISENVSSEMLKFCVSLCVRCCMTRIRSDSRAGFEVVEPVILSADDRAICVRWYDICVNELKARERTYIPDLIERASPERGRLEFLIRQFFAKRTGNAVQAQSKGTQFNRLFGSRG